MRNNYKNIKQFGLRFKIELNILSVYGGRYTKNKITTNSDKVYTNSRGLIVSAKGEYFTVISINSLLLYENKHYLQ